METPEQEPQPNNPEALFIQCEYCEEPFALTDQTAELYLFTNPKYTRYSFLQVKCPQDECARVHRYFVDIDDVHTLGYLSNIHVMPSIPPDAKEYLREAYRVYVNGVQEPAPPPEVDPQEVIIESFRKFIYEYEVEPYEFNKLWGQESG